MPKKIFVTGGAGYIGCHTCLELLKQNYEIMVFDDLSSGSAEAIRRVELLTTKKLKLVIGDIRDEIKLKEELIKFRPDTIMHFAGLKAVGQSVTNPLVYYDVNVRGALNILRAMSEIGCTEIIFSSSATVYDNKIPPPYKETDQKNPLSPYGRTKLIFEMALEDWVNSSTKNHAVVLRYFNPVGAHGSGLLGEAPQSSPSNLMPYIAQVASKKKAVCQFLAMIT